MLIFKTVFLLISTTFAQDYVQDELIVKYKKDKIFFLSKYPEMTIQKTFRASGAFHVSIESTESLQNTINKLKEDNDFEYIEKNYFLDLMVTPNDTFFSEQYAHLNTGQTGGLDDADIDTAIAWNLSKGSKRVLVAVIDTGIDYTHQDIAPNYWFNNGEMGKDSRGGDKRTNGIDDDRNGYVDDYRGWDFSGKDNNPMDFGKGHGTHCAGIIGARGNNGLGIAGVNWYVSMVALKIFSRFGSTTSASIEAVEYATQIGVDIMSNSWGGGAFSRALKSAIEEANSKGILFVAAAGNNSRNIDRRKFYPASYEVNNVISVAATDSSDRLASYSNYGVNQVDVGAPGTLIFSTLPGNQYGLKNGTSMAAPQVSGLAALIKARYSRSTINSIKRRIFNTGDRVTSLTGKTKTGRRINASKALR